jgi:hypothetical protein
LQQKIIFLSHRDDGDSKQISLISFPAASTVIATTNYFTFLSRRDDGDLLGFLDDDDVEFNVNNCISRDDGKQKQQQAQLFPVTTKNMV